jgi:hypothetical protein
MRLVGTRRPTQIAAPLQQSGDHLHGSDRRCEQAIAKSVNLARFK